MATATATRRRAENFPKPILFFVFLNLGGVSEAFFDGKQIPDCAKGGIHAGAKLGSLVVIVPLKHPYSTFLGTLL